MSDEDSTNQQASLGGLRAVLGLAWVGFFLFAFFQWGPTFSFGNGAAELSRTDILIGNVPGSAVDKLFPLLGHSLLDQLLGGSNPKVEGWQFFQWRLVVYATGLAIGMLMLGRLLLRLVGFDRSRRTETAVFAYALGASAMSLVVLWFGLAGVLNATVFCGLLIAAAVVEAICMLLFRSKQPTSGIKTKRAATGTVAFCLVLIAPMALMMLLGAMSPSTDFDVREYHLQGPKEHFQNGQITFLPHNAYTSFPFLTEMLSLLGMVVMGDWHTGALLGKVLLAAFAPMTALSLLAAGKRCFDSRTGWLAALVFMTTPWVYRISIIAYAEGGLTFFLFLSLLAVVRFAGDRSLSNAALLGLMCGSAMACKYPALLSVVAPCGLALLWLCWKPGTSETGAQSQSSTAAATVKLVFIFAAGVAVAVGPWLLKNFAETGNPVYPLGYSVFGGADWTPEIDARWKAAHSPPNHRLSDLASRAVDVSLRSDWMSPLLFGFAPLALLVVPAGRKYAVGFWLFMLWMFGSWWIFTHRIDRFWVPMIPVIALLAGAGLASIRRNGLRFAAGVLVTVLVSFNVVFASIWGGYNAWFKDPVQARKETDQKFASVLLRAESYNRQLAEPGRVLSVGEAAVFEARSKVMYNTVFDLNLFQHICGERVTGGPDSNVQLRALADVRDRLMERDVRFIITDWLEVLRYRAPGSYGFSDFVSPRQFDKLVDGGILRRLDVAEVEWNGLSEHDQRQVTRWGIRRGNAVRAGEIFEVVWK
jgi:4-amino-4-deoxy-L-arabinose transferase-like glycosyltransferase